MRQRIVLFAIASMCCYLLACTPDAPVAVGVGDENSELLGSTGKGGARTTALFFENFETAPTKASYAAGTLTINSVVWTLDNALLNPDGGDKKNGTKSIRMKNGGKVSFTKPSGGAGTISLFTGAYSTDVAGTITITANGVLVGTISVPAGVLNAPLVMSASFPVNQSDPVTFVIEQTAGNRINIDDINITDGMGMPPPMATPEQEPNNTNGSGQTISSGAFMSGTLSGTDGAAGVDNQDYFQLGGTGSLIVLYVETSSPSAPNMFQLLDATGLIVQNRIFVLDNGDGKYKSTIIARVDPAAKYQARVFRFLASGVMGTYTMRYRRTNGKIFLFDAAHAQDAGNADWVIDRNALNVIETFPTPSQTEPNLTASSWKGYYSSLAIALVNKGHAVMTVPPGKSIMLNSNGTQDIYLKMCDVFVSLEPNTKYTPTEITAIRDFVNTGGGFLAIADHTTPNSSADGSILPGNYMGVCEAPSDRNNDGWDSPRILNEVLQMDMGLKFDLTAIAEPAKCSGTSEVSTNKSTLVGNADVDYLLKGKGGVQGSSNDATPLNAISMYWATTMTLTGGANAKGLFWENGVAPQGTTKVRAGIAKFGTGRVFGFGDTSTFSDGSGLTQSPYNSWDLDGSNMNAIHHRNLLINACLWLAKF